MKKFLAFAILFCGCLNAFADDPQPALAPRVSLFSTTVDWQAVTGLPWSQYTGKIKGVDKALVKQGLVLYYLDAFPCYGEASNVRVWLSPNGKPNHDLRIVCIYKPETISFAWRNADEDALDARSTGILTCPVKGDRHFEIDISKCERGKDWKDM